MVKVDIVVEDNIMVEDDIVVDVVVLIVDVDVTAISTSGLLPPDFKTSPFGKITARTLCPKKHQ